MRFRTVRWAYYPFFCRRYNETRGLHLILFLIISTDFLVTSLSIKRKYFMFYDVLCQYILEVLSLSLGRIIGYPNLLVVLLSLFKKSGQRSRCSNEATSWTTEECFFFFNFWLAQDIFSSAEHPDCRCSPPILLFFPTWGLSQEVKRPGREYDKPHPSSLENCLSVLSPCTSV